MRDLADPSRPQALSVSAPLDSAVIRGEGFVVHCVHCGSELIAGKKFCHAWYVRAEDFHWIQAEAAAQMVATAMSRSMSRSVL